jgi:hypothetical protein
MNELPTTCKVLLAPSKVKKHREDLYLIVYQTKSRADRLQRETKSLCKWRTSKK